MWVSEKVTSFLQESDKSQKGVFFMGSTVQKNFIKEMIKENQISGNFASSTYTACCFVCR